jgi:type I restriction enzyme, S subunit
MRSPDWDYFPCSEIFALSSGLPYTQAEPHYDGHFPIYGSSGLSGYGKKQLSHGLTIIIGRVGEGGVGSVRYSEHPAWVTDNALWTDHVAAAWSPKFVAAYLSWLDLRRFRSQTGQPLITQKIIGSVAIPKPPLREQQRIAEILDAVDNEITAAEAVIAKLREVRTATIRAAARAGIECYQNAEAFELYSGAQRSAGSWSLVPLKTVLLGIDAGHSPNLEDTPAGTGQWGVLKVSAVGQYGFIPEENKVVHDPGLRNLALCVREGDLLITRANTSQLVGRSCIVGETPVGLMLCDKTLRLRVDERSVPTRYVHIILGLAEVRRQIEIAATGTSGSMKNISQQSIRQLMVPLGRPDDIQRVAKIDTLHEDQMSAINRKIAKLRLVKQGLMEDLLTGRVRVSDL